MTLAFNSLNMYSLCLVVHVCLISRFFIDFICSLLFPFFFFFFSPRGIIYIDYFSPPRHFANHPARILVFSRSSLKSFYHDRTTWIFFLFFFYGTARGELAERGFKTEGNEYCLPEI